MNECVEKQIADVIIGESNLRRVFFVGDSTVSPFNDDIFMPRAGYATAMPALLDKRKAESVNLALPGRSSKSFIAEKNYALLLQHLKKDDFLIIAFGHNDEKYDFARYTNPINGIEDETSFQHYLFTYYCMQARSVGAFPVLCTPIVRRSPSGVYTGNFVHITEDCGSFRGGDYPESIRKLGKTANIPVVDNTALTRKLYTELGVQGSAALHAQLTEDAATIDNTHLNKHGAACICRLFAAELARCDADFASLLVQKT